MIATFAIPCRNGAVHLRALLESLLRQSRQDFELVLVDDASSDDSVEIARATAGDRVVVHQNPTALGLAANWNRCVQLAQTPFVCLAHMDDVYATDYFATMADRLTANPSAAAAHCRVCAIDTNGRALESATERYKERFWVGLESAARGDVYRRLFRGNFIICPSVLYRTELLREAGGFDETLHFAPDWQMWFDLLARGHDLSAEPRVLMDYRRHATSATQAATRSFARYGEELDVLDRAAERGLRAGFLDERTARRRDAVRNNVLYDAYVSLRNGDADESNARIDHLLQRAPQLARDRVVRWFRRLARSGALGRIVLSLGLRATLR